MQCYDLLQLLGKVGKGVRAQTHNVKGTQGLFNTENMNMKTTTNWGAKGT